MVIEKPQKVEIQKIDSMVVLIWPGDLMLIEPEVEAFAAFLNSTNFPIYKYLASKVGYYRVMSYGWIWLDLLVWSFRWT